MNFTVSAFVTSLVTGSIGYVYWSFGRKMTRPLYMASGALLMVYPYFIESLPISILVGALLTAAPILIKV